MMPAFLACKSAREPLDRGAIVIGLCKYCYEPLQLSPELHRQWVDRPHADLVCHPCAAALTAIADSHELERGLEKQLAQLVLKRRKEGTS